MKKKASENSLIILVERYDWNVDLNMGYNHSFIEGYGLNENGAIIHIDLKKEMETMIENTHKHSSYQWKEISNCGPRIITDTYIREDWLEAFQTYRKRGRSSVKIIQMISADILSKEQ